MPQEFRIPFKPQKSMMPKKSRIPQATSREVIGKENNKKNDKNKSGGDQRVLNNVSNISGYTFTPEGITHPVGWLYTWGTLLAMVPPLDFPDQQRLLKKTTPAFEVNTRIDVRRNGNQTRVHSFVSTSTINRGRIQPSIFLNKPHNMSHHSTAIVPSLASANSLFWNQTCGNQTSATASQDVDIAKRAHELSVFFHQKVHDLYQLVNCTTTRRTDQVKTWIVTGESVEQTSFTTVCQGAIGKAETQNSQGMKQESENPTFSSHYMTNTTEHGFHPFSAKEAAQKLSKVFQASFEKQHNATIDTPNHIHNQVTETFWNGLTERFYQFFYQHEHMDSSQEQARGRSWMSYFVDLLLQTFSVDYGKQAPINLPSKMNLNYQMKSPFSNPALQTKKKQPEGTPKTVSEPVLGMTPKTMMKNESVLNPKKEGFLPQISKLATDFYEVVDSFLQQSIGLQFLGAEAMPLPPTSIPSLELEENQLTFNETQISETTTESSHVNGTTPYVEGAELEVTRASESNDTQEINEKIQAFLRENADNPTKIVVQETKEESHPPEWTSEQKENIRQKIVDFFTEKGIACQESNAKDLIETVGEWVLLEGASPATLDMVKVKELAKIILEMGEETVISEEQAGLTVGSWVYETMKDIQPKVLNLVAETTTQPEEVGTPQPISTDNKIERDGIQWRDPNVRKEVETFLRKKILSPKPTKEEVLIAMGKWITKEENNQLVFDYEKLQPMAKVILKALHLHDGKNEEELSNKDAELTVMKWAFETILGSSIEAYMIKKIVSAPDIDQFTMGRLRELFTVRNLEKEGLIQLDVSTLSQKQKTFFNKLWNLFLQRELPNYFLDSSGLADELLISDYASLMQLTGAKILKEGEYQYPFSQEEARLMGEHFWQTILEKKITSYEEFRHLLMPSLLAVAQLEPDLLREALATGTYKEVAISTFIGYQQEGYFQLVEHQELLDRLYKAYQEALLQWRRKEALATTVAQTCIDRFNSSFRFYEIKQRYLEGSTKPCPDIEWFQPKIEDVYTKLTKNVSEAHVSFDKKMIEFALNAVDQEERAFIFSKTTTLYEGFAELKNETHYTGGIPGTGGMLLINLRGRVMWEDTTLSLDKTDLFVAVNGKEERWYALKRLDEEGGYLLYRVDQDPLSYLKYGLLNRKDLWGKGYQQVGNEIRIGDKYFQFSARVNRSKKLSHGVEMEPLIETLSRKHSDQLYKQLYDSGNDKADTEKLWEVIKHFIPFYDCVVGIINQDVGEAITSCTIDALLFIPIVGQITSLNMKFALGVARAFARGGIRSVIKNSRHFLPNVAEIRKLVWSLAQAIDPGFETIVSGGRLVIQKALKFKNEFRVGMKTKALLEKIEIMEKAREALKKEIMIGELNGLEVPVKKMSGDLYMRVTNLDTAEVFGGLYVLKGKQLEPYRGPAKFTTEQLELIDRLEFKLDKDQMYVVKNNPDPQAYGEGRITTVIQEGEETKRFIRMKGKLIPVGMQSIEGHGVRMYIKDPAAKKFLPVNYNGMEWYFEAPTSHSIPKEVETKIVEQLDQFETQKNPIFLSAPDSRIGLIWDGTNRSYIKIKEHYIPLILLDQEFNRYHLVKKDYNEAMTVLRFDEKKDQFRFETELEKKQVIEAFFTDQLMESMERHRRVKETASTSREGKAISTSRRGKATSAAKGRTALWKTYPPFNVLPNPPGHAKEWTKFRNAIPFQREFIIPRVEDPSVSLDKFSTFLPVKPPIYYDNKEWLNKTLKKMIRENFPVEPRRNFRVYVGLKSDEAPDYIQLFRKKLVGEFRKSKETCIKSKEICDNLLSKKKLAKTQEGQYLIKLFQLEDVSNKEVILREIVTRLKLIAEKGETFLKKIADFGFDNIWIVSTSLVREKGTTEYRSAYKELAQASISKYDPECRMFIYADAFHLDPAVNPGKETKPVGREVILHEMTHILEETEDWVRYSYTNKGFSKSAEDTLNDFMKVYDDPTLLESEQFNEFASYVAKSLNMPTISIKAVARAIMTIPMLRANFQMMDAEMLMIILRDFADGRKFKERPIVKRSVDDNKSGNWEMFTYLTLGYILGGGIFERNLQLNKTQEQITTRTTDNISANLRNKEVTETVEITKGSVNRTSLNLVMDTEAVITITPSVSEQPMDTKLLKPTVKQGFLDLVVTSIEKSTKKNSNSTQINLNQKELRLQH